MAKDIQVPDIGGATDVDVIEIHVKPGDSVTKEATLITLEGDKATMDIPSPEEGIIKELKVALGDKVSEGSIILSLEATISDDSLTELSKSEVTTAPPQQPSKAEATPATKAPAQTESERPIVVPDLGGFKDVDVIEVYVKPGDQVEADGALIALETDKATMDVPSECAGIIQSLTVGVGDKVSEGDIIGTLVTQSAAQNENRASNAEVKVAPPTQSKSTSSQPTGKAIPGKMPTGTTKTQPGIHAGPAVRRYARILGVDLARVKDTGPRGRILKEDVEAYVREALDNKQSPQPVAGVPLLEMPAVDFSKFGEIEEQPLNKIKRLTGQNMHRNWSLVPHVTQFDEADITELETFRKSQKHSAEAKGIKLTMVSFLMKAVVGALKEHPIFNASLGPNGDTLIMKKYYHIGMAADTPNGLLVPVIRNVDKKGLFEIAEEVTHVSQKAREKGLSPAEMQGSCFTISSLGGVGGTAFTPIVNAPDVAILGVSRAAMKPVFHNGEFVPRLMLPLSLSYDHRVIDGVAAARFTTTLGILLSDIRKLLL